MSVKVATIDFHVTSECSQECPYCWGPQDFENPVDTATALRIVSRVKQVGASRIVLTGGDPLKRPDIAELIHHAAAICLEVALSTTGDEEGHIAAVVKALEWLREHPDIDVKVCTPVTRHNLADVPNIARLVEDYSRTTEARVFYNIFQAFPRAMFEVEWDELLVSDEEFADLEERLRDTSRVRVNFLTHATLDRLYMMIFPDGSLVIPCGREFPSYGAFLEITDFETVLEKSRFAWERHLRHSQGWVRRAKAQPQNS